MFSLLVSPLFTEFTGENECEQPRRFLIALALQPVSYLFDNVISRMTPLQLIVPSVKADELVGHRYSLPMEIASGLFVISNNFCELFIRFLLSPFTSYSLCRDFSFFLF